MFLPEPVADWRYHPVVAAFALVTLQALVFATPAAPL